jgi:hypothetical protein
VLQKSSEREQVSEIAYINRVVTTWDLPYLLLPYKVVLTPEEWILTSTIYSSIDLMTPHLLFYKRSMYYDKEALSFSWNLSPDF